MPDARDHTLFQWGEDLRRRQAARRARSLHMAVTVAATITATLLCATLLLPPRPLLVWNASASSPVGLYLVTAPIGIEVGDMIVAWPSPEGRRVGAARHYLPSNVPLVKRVAAVGGDRVCATRERISVNGRLAALRRSHDRAGRPMPWWNGCENLRRGDVFLLTPSVADSFDGRYFGVTSASEVVGEASALWAR